MRFGLRPCLCGARVRGGEGQCRGLDGVQGRNSRGAGWEARRGDHAELPRHTAQLAGRRRARGCRGECRFGRGASNRVDGKVQANEGGGEADFVNLIFVHHDGGQKFDSYCGPR